MKTGNFSGAGHEGARVFGINPAFNRVTAYAHLLLADRERQSGGNPQLLFNQVNAGDHFRHRMLHLNAGIHFDKVKLALLIEKFEGTGAAIADVQTGFGAALADSPADPAVIPGAGASSTTFWWRRCIEQSRSAR